MNNRNSKLSVSRALFMGGVVLAAPVVAHAQQPDLGSVFGQVQQAANGWIPIIMSAATRLFFLLASIDFAWSVPGLLREHDFMGLFQGLIKRLLVIGIFYGILEQGQNWIPAIVESFVQIGSTATGLPNQLNPTDIMGRGIQIGSDLLTKTHNANLLTQFGAVLTTMFLVAIVFISYGIITLHYIVTKLEAIIVMSAGYLFLGFGGSRWTLPYFERYIALAIATGTRLMLIYLMLGVFQTVAGQWESTMSAWDPSQPIGPMFSEVAAMLLFAFASWMIPKMAASLASGSLGLGASDLFAVGGAAAAGTLAGATTVAAVAAAPFTGGGSLAAEAGMMGLEASTLTEGAGTVAVGLSAAASAATGAEATPTLTGAGGIPANVPPPPTDAQMEVGSSPAAPTPDSSTSQTAPATPVTAAEHGAPVATAATVTSDATTTEARAKDSGSAAESAAGDDAAHPAKAGSNTGERRAFPAIPDDGAAHIPPPQLRIDREE
jgi:type IV secretion system protein TrbL